MPEFYAIAAMAEDRVIGRNGRLPWHLPQEYRWFKHKTMGGTMVMGRPTFESIGKPLPGRKTIVLTRRELTIPGVEICHDATRLTGIEGTGWICGGTDVYRQLLPKCSRLYLTRVKQRVEGDAFFPEFENVFELDQMIYDGPDFRVERWINRAPGTERPEPETWPFN
jgi:dihydrofolate reductase